MKRELLLTAALLGLGALSAQATVQTTATTVQTTYPSGATSEQLQAVTPLLEGLNSLQSSYLDEQQGRVVVVGLNAVDRLTLLVRLRNAGLPTNIVSYQTGQSAGGSTGTVTQTPSTPAPLPSATSLPSDGAKLNQPHSVVWTGPASFKAGEPTLWSFNLKNTGTQTIRLSHGACDVRFEVINAAGEIIRPDPKNTICTMQIVNTEVQPGELQEVQKIRWDGKDGQGQVVPAGTYTIRAVFKGAGFNIPSPALSVDVR